MATSETSLGGSLRVYAWEFEENGRPLNVRVDGQIICNDPGAIASAALLGLGIAYVPEDTIKLRLVDPFVALGRLGHKFAKLRLHIAARRAGRAAFSFF